MIYSGIVMLIILLLQTSVSSLQSTIVWRKSHTRVQMRFESSKPSEADSIEDSEDDFSRKAFQHAIDKLNEGKSPDLDLDEFDGYDLRDVIMEKWGECYDVDFNRVDSFGFRKLYLNVLPFRLGRRPFRHASEYDYLCHLQAVVEILREYGQLDYILYQIAETSKRPIAGRSPIVAVPLRLDLTREQVEQILGY